MINRVGRGGASSWTLWQEQLPSTDMCKVPGLHDRNRNGPTHQAASLLVYQVQRVEGLRHRGGRDGGTGPRSSDKHACSYTTPDPQHRPTWQNYTTEQRRSQPPCHLFGSESGHPNFWHTDIFIRRKAVLCGGDRPLGENKAIEAVALIGHP